jgi:hypothetical protein
MVASEIGVVTRMTTYSMAVKNPTQAWKFCKSNFGRKGWSIHWIQPMARFYNEERLVFFKIGFIDSEMDMNDYEFMKEKLKK